MPRFFERHKMAEVDRAAIDRRLPFLNALFKYKDPVQNGLQYWRERILFSVLAVGTGLSLVALAPAIHMFVIEKMWPLLVFVLLVFLLAGSLLVLPRVSLEMRTVAALFIAFLMGVVVIWEMGFVSGGAAWLFCFAVLTAVLMGLRAALVAVVLNAAAVVFLALMARKGLIGDPFPAVSTGRTVAAIANFLFLNTVCSVSVAALVNGLQALNKRVISASAELDNERRKLLAAREVLKQEVAERKESEMAARESERKYRLLAENIRDVIWTMDTEMRFTYVSPAISQVQGWRAEEYLDLTLEQVMPPASCRKVIDAYTTQFSLGEQTGDFNRSATLELELYTKSGSTVWTEVTAGFLVKEDGRPAGVLGVTRDITERRRAEKEKEELMESLNHSRKMEALGTLAGGVAHDLNNVLSGIVSYPDLLLMDIPSDSPLKQPIETMRASGQKAAAIVQDLLTLARRGVTTAEVVDLNEVVREYLDSPECERLKSYHPLVALDVRLSPDLCPTVGSPFHLFKALINLVSNAAEAMPNGGELTIATENRRLDEPLHGYTRIPRGQYAVLRVSDTGVGIAAEDLKRIFEPFYTKKKMGRSGTGLGMAVVWGTVQDHGGFIDVESAVGMGTALTLFFPGTEKVPEKAAVPGTSVASQVRGVSVLVVDDVREQREVATKILEQIGYSAVSVASGEAAVAFMEKHSVDLLLLDMIMDPGIDGLETYKRILRQHPQQRAVITSGYAETERVKEARRLGTCGYLKKPYTVNDMSVAIESVLGG